MSHFGKINVNDLHEKRAWIPEKESAVIFNPVVIRVSKFNNNTRDCQKLVFLPKIFHWQIAL